MPLPTNKEDIIALFRETKKIADRCVSPPSKSTLERSSDFRSCDVGDKVTSTIPTIPRIKFLAADSIVAASEIMQITADGNPLIMNLANRFHVGGGCENGAVAQEESLFYRTNYYKSLYDPNIARTRPDGRSFHYNNPIPHDAAYYTKDITVLRDQEYNQLHQSQQFHINCVAIAGYNLGKYTHHNYINNSLPLPVGEEEKALFNAYKQDVSNNEARTFPRLQAKFIELTKQKIKLMLQIAATKGHNSLVLGAISCGAFRLQNNKNPAWTANCVAEAYTQAFSEAQFEGLLGKFTNITFAVLNQKNTDTDKINVDVFKKLAEETLPRILATNRSTSAARTTGPSPIRFTPKPQSSSSSSSSYSTLPSQNAYASTSYSDSSSGSSSYSSGLTQEHAGTKKRDREDDNDNLRAKKTVQSSSNKVYEDVTRHFDQLEEYHKEFLSGIFKIYKDRNNKEFFNKVAHQIRLLKSSSVALNSIVLSMESIIQLDDIKISDLSSLKEDLLDFVTTKMQSQPQFKKTCNPKPSI